MLDAAMPHTVERPHFDRWQPLDSEPSFLSICKTFPAAQQTMIGRERDVRLNMMADCKAAANVRFL